MHLPNKLFSGILLLATALFTLSSCGNNDDATPVPRKDTYQFTAFGNHNITGTAVFTEILNTDSTQVTVTLKGNEINDLSSLPVKIRQGTSIEDGEILYDLGNYNGSTTQLTKAVKLSYDKLADLNASIGVYNPNNGDILSQAEIGSNSTYKSFTMKNPAGTTNGQFRIYKRGTGSYIVIKVNLSGLADACKGQEHPVTVLGSDGLPDSAFTLNAVADSNGVSATTLSDHDYDEMTKYKGSLTVSCSEAALITIISQGSF